MNVPARHISVVIPVHNGASSILRQLEALRVALTGMVDCEVLVVNNRSTDDTAKLVGAWAQDSPLSVSVVEANDRPGEPYARNVGWRNAEGEIILFCDADDVVAETWASGLLEALEKAEFATGPLITESINGPEVANVRGQALFQQMARLHDTVPFAHGANMGFRRKTLETLGGFDEQFLIGCDIELAIRAWRAGIDLVWAPAAAVHYRLRSTPRGVYAQARAYGKSRSLLDAQVPEVRPSVRARRLHQVKRMIWLFRRLPQLTHLSGRLRWLWVLGQVRGELETGRNS